LEAEIQGLCTDDTLGLTAKTGLAGLVFAGFLKTGCASGLEIGWGDTGTEILGLSNCGLAAAGLKVLADLRSCLGIITLARESMGLSSGGTKPGSKAKSDLGISDQG